MPGPYSKPKSVTIEGGGKSVPESPYRVGYKLMQSGILPYAPSITIKDKGGKATAKKTQMQQLQSKVMNVALKTWEDRNSNNTGSKLSAKYKVK